MAARVRVGGALALALALAACGRPSSDPEPASTEPPAARLRPEAEAAEKRLGSTLARLSGRERSAAFQRCPPADERFEAAMAEFGAEATRCHAARAEPTGCDAFVARLLDKPLETIGCVYESPLELSRDPGTQGLDGWRALRIAFERARARAAAGATDDAARLGARVVRAGGLLLRGDDRHAWSGADALARWVPEVLDWLALASADAATAVRADLDAARGAWLDIEFGLRALLLREADRGRVTGGLEGEVHEEAALVMLDALAEGASVEALEAELDAAVRASESEASAIAARHGADLTPRERGLLVTLTRRTMVKQLAPIVASHARAAEAMQTLPR